MDRLHGRASGKASGSFLKKRTKKLLQIQAEPLRKGRSQADNSFLLLFFKKERLAFLPSRLTLHQRRGRKSLCK
jgi:hypothetical protein